MNNHIITKKCYKCQHTKPISEFNKCKSHKDGLGSYCKHCIRLLHIKNKDRITKYRKQYYTKNKKTINQRTRRHHFMSRYGISEEEASQLVKNCHNACQICGTRLCSANPPHIDHNHKTGAIRGVLCRCCNSGLGLFMDNPDYLATAIRYLQK